MPTRTITGTVYHPGTNTPWSGVAVVFELLAPFTIGGITYPTERTTVTTGGDGTFTISVAVPSTGTAIYYIQVPGVGVVAAALADGAATDIAVLFAAAGTSTAQTAIQSAIDAEAAIRSAADVVLASADTTHAALTYAAHGGSLGLLGIYNARSYGALGDGTTDDRASIQAALDAAKAVGGGVVFLPKGTYLIKRPLWIGSKVALQGSGRGATIITKPATVKSLLTANASAGATSVTVADSTGFVVGGPIHLSDTSSWEWISTQGTISGIAGNVITFANSEGLGRTGLDGALQTARTATAYTSFPLIRNDLASTQITVRDLTLDQAKGANDPAAATYDFTLGIIHWVETYYSLIENCALLNACADAYSDQAQDGTGITPSAGIIKTTKNTIRNCRIRDANRHAVHLGTCMNGAFVQDNEMTNCGDDGSIGVGHALFYCAYATNTVATGNIVEGCGQGFSVIDERDTGNVIANNIIRNCRTWAVQGTGAGTGGRCVIANNIITGGRGILWTEPDCVISNNWIELATGSDGIQLTATADRTLVQGNSIQGNGTSGSTGVQLVGCDDVRMVGNNIRGMAKGVSVRGVARLVAVGNIMSGFTSRSWYFEVSPSTDCSISDEMNVFSTPIDETGSTPVRLVVNGMGDNGASNPASAGDWNVTGRRHDGRMVHWNDDSARISIYRHGAGWIQVV
jgi:hypothetical protein